MVESYYAQAMDEFKGLFSEEYYQQLLEAHKNLIGGVYQGKKEISAIGGTSDELKSIFSVSDLWHTGITDAIETVVKEETKTRNAHQEVHRYVQSESKNLSVSSFNLDSDGFLRNMALLAINNPAVAVSINTQFDKIELGLADKTKELERFREKRALFGGNEAGSELTEGVELQDVATLAMVA